MAHAIRFSGPTSLKLLAKDERATAWVFGDLHNSSKGACARRRTGNNVADATQTKTLSMVQFVKTVANSALSTGNVSVHFLLEFPYADFATNHEARTAYDAFVAAPRAHGNPTDDIGTLGRLYKAFRAELYPKRPTLTPRCKFSAIDVRFEANVCRLLKPDPERISRDAWTNDFVMERVLKPRKLKRLLEAFLFSSDFVEALRKLCVVEDVDAVVQKHALIRNRHVIAARLHSIRDARLRSTVAKRLRAWLAETCEKLAAAARTKNTRLWFAWKSGVLSFLFDVHLVVSLVHSLDTSTAPSDGARQIMAVAYVGDAHARRCSLELQRIGFKLKATGVSESDRCVRLE
jgi:hypothetical protein